MVELLDLVARFRQILVRESAVSRNEPLAVVNFNHVAPERVGVDFCHAPVLYGDDIVALCAAEVDAVVNPPVVRRLVFHHLVRAVVLADVRAHRQSVAAGIWRVFAVIFFCRLRGRSRSVVGDILHGVVRLRQRFLRHGVVYIVLPRRMLRRIIVRRRFRHAHRAPYSRTRRKNAERCENVYSLRSEKALFVE